MVHGWWPLMVLENYLNLTPKPPMKVSLSLSLFSLFPPSPFLPFLSFPPFFSYKRGFQEFKNVYTKLASQIVTQFTKLNDKQRKPPRAQTHPLCRSLFWEHSKGCSASETGSRAMRDSDVSTLTRCPHCVSQGRIALCLRSLGTW